MNGKTICMAVMVLLAAGCVSYVDPAERNPGKKDDYTRAETIAASQRLVKAMLADPVFAGYYAAKVQQRGGAPVVQVAHIANCTPERNHSLEMLREDLEEALRASGRFVLGGDPDACDYILRGEYRKVHDDGRTTHRVSVRLHDISSDTAVWTRSDEIAKE